MGSEQAGWGHESAHAAAQVQEHLLGSLPPHNRTHVQAEALPQLVVVGKGPEDARAGGQARQVARRQLVQYGQQELIRHGRQRAQPALAQARRVVAAAAQHAHLWLYAMRVCHAVAARCSEARCG